ncbi:MAG: carbonic anhydrase [Candidatus Obscuribacterales bacterium]|nr:carbonic anhydrase [Candidatus Obscuribacterales bacterium]
MLRLMHGLHQFEKEVHTSNQDFFARLAQKQSPDAIFITCSDSRIDPNLLTGTAPGELFIIRNAGNIVPDYNEHIGGEAASIEFAIEVLGVKDIIVCGHSQCGAIRGLLNPDSLTEMPTVSQWLKHAERTKRILSDNYHEQDSDCVHNIAVQENVLVQMENLRTLPCIARKVMKREIEIHGWVYEIESGRVYIYDPVDEEFLPITLGKNGYELVSGDGLPTSV